MLSSDTGNIGCRLETQNWLCVLHIYCCTQYICHVFFIRCTSIYSMNEGMFKNVFKDIFTCLLISFQAASEGLCSALLTLALLALSVRWAYQQIINLEFQFAVNFFNCSNQTDPWIRSNNTLVFYDVHSKGSQKKIARWIFWLEICGMYMVDGKYANVGGRIGSII